MQHRIIQEIRAQIMSRFVFIAIILLTGCDLLPAEQLPTTVGITIPSITPAPTITSPTLPVLPSTTPLPAGLQDVLPILSGICFEAAWDAAGQVFILRNAEEHIRFYNLADNSGLCRRPVTRHPFDFTQGDVLAGLWSRGTGCVARYDIVNYTRDDAAKTVRIDVDFMTDGDCPYELVRGFWVSVSNAQDYEIAMQVVN
jgi:hypothetical protein